MHRPPEGEFVEFAAIFVHRHDVHLADEVAGPHVDADEGVVAEPHPRPGDRFGLLAATGSPYVAVGHDGVCGLVAAIALWLTGLKVVSRSARGSDRGIDGGGVVG